MAGVPFALIGLWMVVVVLISAGGSKAQTTGIVRFTNKSNTTVVTINNLSEEKIMSNIGYLGVAEFNQSINSTSVFLFQIVNSNTRELIANLVVPTWTNVSFIDVKYFPHVVVAVGDFPTS